MIERFGRTLILLFGLFLFIEGGEMVLHIGDPVTRKLSASLADALASK